VLATLGVAAVSAFGALAIAGFKAAAELGTAANRIGVSAESLSRLKFAAEQSDVQFEALTVAIKRFQVITSSAASGSKEAAGALGALHLSAKDLANLPLEAQLAKIADQFVLLKDPADKTRAAVELFGRSGEQLVPMLNKGGAGIRDLTREADALGITLDGKTVRSIDAADKALKKLKDTLSAFGSHVAGSVALAIMGPQDEVDAATIRLEGLIKKRQELLSSSGNVNFRGGAGKNALADLNAQIKGAQEGLEVLQRAAKFAAGGDQPPVIEKLVGVMQELNPQTQLAIDQAGTWLEKMQQLDKETRTALENIEAQFQESSKAISTLVQAGLINDKQATERLEAAKQKFNDALDIGEVHISAKKLIEPLSLQQERIREAIDTVKEGLTNLAQSGETSGRAILRYLLAAFESKLIFRAIDKIGSALEKSLLSATSGKSGFAGVLGSVISGLFGGGASADSLQPVVVTAQKIPVHAAGGGNMSGARIVGEEGPELLLGSGQVFNRRQLQFAMAGMGGVHYAPSTTIQINGSGNPEQTAALVEIRIQQNNRKQAEELNRRLKINGFGDLR
jgi:tetratricopeptide (TPR) repeat protein